MSPMATPPEDAGWYPPLSETLQRCPAPSPEIAVIVPADVYWPFAKLAVTTSGMSSSSMSPSPLSSVRLPTAGVDMMSSKPG